MLRIILLVLAAVCFLFLAIGQGVGDLRLLPIGLLLWVLADLFGGWALPFTLRRNPPA